MKALVAQIEARAREKPVLMVVEDTHWADPTTLELLDRLVDRIAVLPALLLVLYRSEMKAPWLGRAPVTELTVHRLTSCEIGAMVDDVVGGESLPAPAREEIILRADGVPLFAEEMTKAVLEAQGAGDEANAADSQTVAVPPSLQASPWRGSIAWAPQRRWRRPQPRSGANPTRFAGARCARDRGRSGGLA